MFIKFQRHFVFSKLATFFICCPKGIIAFIQSTQPRIGQLHFAYKRSLYQQKEFIFFLIFKFHFISCFSCHFSGYEFGQIYIRYLGSWILTIFSVYEENPYFSELIKIDSHFRLSNCNRSRLGNWEHKRFPDNSLFCISCLVSCKFCKAGHCRRRLASWRK